MKWQYLILMVLLLAACGTAQNDNKGNGISPKTDTPKVENIISQEKVESPFTLKLVSDKEQYKVGEKPSIRAELVYSGDEDFISIGHAASWIWLETTNLTKNYQFGAFMDQPYIITNMTKGEVITQPYHFSGSMYHEEMEGNAYTESELQKMGEGYFSPGQYEIHGRTDFVIEGQPDKKYQLEASVIFEVIE